MRTRSIIVVTLSLAMLFVAARLILAQEAALELGASVTTLVSRVVPAAITFLILMVNAARGTSRLTGISMSWIGLLLVHGVLETGGSLAVLIGSEGVVIDARPCVAKEFFLIGCEYPAAVRVEQSRVVFEGLN